MTESTATIHGEYRYDLTRRWGPGPSALWIMLNPSTADASIDDPTIRRCISFSKREGCGSLVVVNLYALRSTDPAALRTHPDPVGPANNEALASWLRRPGVSAVIGDWGAHPAAAARAPKIIEAVSRTRHRLVCLGRTKSGAPRHPLYVAGTTTLEDFCA